MLLHCVVVASAAGPEIVELATAIQGAQDPEIVLMQSLLESWGQPTAMPGMEDTEGMSSDEMEGMDHGGMEGMMSGEEMAALGTLTGAAQQAEIDQMRALLAE